MEQFFDDYTLRTVTLGTAILGAVSGALGTFAVLRRQSLLGDAVSHAALPGIGLAFILTSSKASLVLMVGAGLAGWLATAVVLLVTTSTRVKYDSALGLVLSVFFGAGLVLLTFIQKYPNANQAGLDSFLFGQAASLVVGDVITMTVLGGIVLVALLLFWKEFKLLAFDPEFAHSLVLPVRWLDIGLTTLLVVAIVIGLQTVGVVLMSAMIIAPAAAARQWTDNLGVMALISMVTGALCGVGGALLSTSTSNLPTGPTIVVCAGGFVVVSMLIAPHRGIIWQQVRQTVQNRKLKSEAVLLDLFELARKHDDLGYPHMETALRVIHPKRGTLYRQLRRLEGRGLVKMYDSGAWALTPDGILVCKQLLDERIR
ncbi:MAG: metal ABC transporter permease [Bacteroidetes bacterium]|nr:metal ABC transporter permease [Bacteroidota bacterium]